jgi:hypothetical protein
MAMNRQDLRRYDLEAWIHTHFYKIASLFSFIEAASILARLLAPSNMTELIFRITTIIYWALLTPSFYEFTKGFLMIYSRGAVYSHIAENIRERLVIKYRSRARAASILLYIAIIIWIIAPVAFIWGWLYAKG